MKKAAKTSTYRGRKAASLPPDPLQVLIDRAYERDVSDKRDYLGASAVGHTCDAILAMILRELPEAEPNGRVKRIFRDGHRVEADVIADLRKAGYFVQEVDPVTGKQFEWTLYNGHVKGHADGVVTIPGSKIWNILEIKSINDKLFNQFRLHGVVKSHPKYFGQVQMMMGMSGYERAMLVAYNKNNAAYAHEFVPFDPIHFSALKARIDRAMSLTAKRLTDGPKRFPCVSCSRNSACWDRNVAQRLVKPACKSCRFSVPSMNPAHPGAWDCTKHGRLSFSPCSDFEVWEPSHK